jgi:PAS domain S-box-containing protein
MRQPVDATPAGSPRFREAEEGYRSIIESVPNGIVIVDEAGTIVLCNSEAEKLFGYDPGELLGQPVERLVPARFRERHPSYRDGFLGNPTKRQMGAGRDLTGVRKDGTEVPVEIGLNHVHSEGSLFVVAAIVDITERKKQEDRFRTIVESMPNGIIMADDRGTIVLCNSEAERLFGYDRGELLGSPVEMLVPLRSQSGHPRDRTRFMQAPRKRQMGAGRDLSGLRKDGSEVPVEIGLNPIETPDGTYVLASIVDISGRKAIEAALRQSEERFRALADDSPVMIWLTDASGAVRFGNRAYCEFFGTSPVSIENGGSRPMVHPDDATRYHATVREALAQQRPFQSPARFQRVDGEWRWIESHGQPRYSVSGDFLGMAGSSPDVTEQKEVERLRETFIGILGHDLRNPLSAMITGTQFAMELTGDEAVRTPLERAVSSGERMVRMIDQLLDLTRIRLGGGIVLAPAEADLRVILDQVLLGVPGGNERFRVETLGDMRGTWDADRLFQVLSNLASNAHEHSPGDTDIHVRIDGRAADAVELRIQNAGPAVPEPARSSMFEPFRTSGERPGASGGLGLGLFISRHLVLAHGGTIDVESRDPTGTTFTVSLPRRAKTAAGASLV